MQPKTQLRRNPAAGRVAGVAAGLSDFFGIDVTLIRVLLVVGAIFSTGAVPLIYLACWALIPPRPPGPQYPGSPRVAPRRGLPWIILVVILVTIPLSASRDLGPIIAVVVAFGIAAWIFRKVRGRQSWRTRKEFEKARLAWQRRLDEQAASQVAPPTYLGGDPFEIGSFYSDPPQGDTPDNPNQGFQTL
ncbi:MAG: PspC domain-containing protein [Propionibacteriaceae bacterium]|jgi:phage shock protein PspC (stress-responsive transcriptional regulator)|nr:PspC domain-containing protein [Propionibacteriaceae bacterium]